MKNSWLRLWHELPNDPKWRTIAKVSGQPISVVIAVYIHLLVDASTNTERGRTHANATNEDIASALDIGTTEVHSVIAAMQNRVLNDDWIIGWEKRQPEREDGSAERAKAWREQQKTQPNARERKRTLDKIREDKIREVLKDTVQIEFELWFETVWWKVYPRREGKGKAKTSCSNALKKISHEELLEATMRYANDPNLPPQKKYIPFPAVWLNQERWNDDPLPTRGEPSVRDGGKTTAEVNASRGLQLVQRFETEESRGAITGG